MTSESEVTPGFTQQIPSMISVACAYITLPLICHLQGIQYTKIHLEPLKVEIQKSFLRHFRALFNQHNSANVAIFQVKDSQCISQLKAHTGATTDRIWKDWIWKSSYYNCELQISSLQ